MFIIVYYNQGHASYVKTVSYSPDGKYIISGSNDNSIKIWDSDTGREIKQLNVN
jgi:WD40 repeat protein